LAVFYNFVVELATTKKNSAKSSNILTLIDILAFIVSIITV